jgi:hypothetical protein
MTPRCIRLALVAAACLAGAAQAQKVAPPPLPIGSQQARPEPGMSEPERKRAVRAHHHKAHHHKDVNHDDSLHGPARAPVRPVVVRPDAGAVPGTTPGSGAAVQGGPGSGPARAQTDKGAASYYFGTDNSKDRK